LIPAYKQPANEFVADQLTRLDTKIKLVLSEDKFRRLFEKCCCGLIMMQQVFRAHICTLVVQAMPVVIDLTTDNDDTITGTSIPIIINLTGDSNSDDLK
jgi:hypothetical protein